MIVIKYQIKYQIDLKDYLLKDDDPLINKGFEKFDCQR